MINSIATAVLFLSTIWGISALPNVESRSRTGISSIPAIRINLLAKNRIAKIQRPDGDHEPDILVPNSSMLSKRQDGSVAAHLNDEVAAFASPVTVGGQTLNLILDTGSSNIWVFSTEQPPEQLQGHSYFDPMKSSTFVDLDQSFKIDYSGGFSITGSTGSDTVTIGETSVATQPFGLADNVPPGAILGGDGIVGLGFNNENVIGSSNFLTMAKPSLSNWLFAAFLPNEGVGAFDFGEIDNTKYNGAVTYTPVSTDGGHWQFDSTAYKIENQIFEEPGNVGFPDTGSSEVLLQDFQALTYYLFVENFDFDESLGAYIYPCDEDLPDFSFLIGPSTYATIPGKDLIGAPLAAKPHMCRGAIQESLLPVNIYGLPFFYNYYAIFDAGNLRFGFAPINIAS